MRVFISWSGRKAQLVAEKINFWLPMVVHGIQTYVSAEDIEKGSRWGQSLASELGKSDFGIICVTKDNINAPWIHFEAGALSKSVDRSKVCPFLLDMTLTDIPRNNPLVLFQATILQSEDVFKLVESVHETAKTEELTSNQLRVLFDRLWPELDSSLRAILQDESLNDAQKHELPRDPTLNALDEIIIMLREQQRASFQEAKSDQESSQFMYEAMSRLSSRTEHLLKLVNSPETILPREYVKGLISDIGTPKALQVLSDLVDQWESLLNSLYQQSTVGNNIDQELGARLSRLHLPIQYLARHVAHREIRIEGDFLSALPPIPDATSAEQS